MSERLMILTAVKDASRRERLKEILRPQYLVAEADNAESLRLEACRLPAPSAVLLDMGFSNYGGIQLLRSFKKDAATALLPVIALGSSVDEEIAALDVGADEFLRFDCEPVVLLRRLHRLLLTADSPRRFSGLTSIEELSALRAVEKEHGMYQYLLDQNGIVVMNWNLKEKSFHASSGVERYAFSTLEGQPVKKEQLFKFCLSEDSSAVEQFIGTVLAGNSCGTWLRLLLRGGGYGWARIIAFVLRNSDGSVDGIIGSITDVDLEMNEHLALVKSKQELRQNLLDLQRQNELRKILLDGSTAVVFQYDIATDSIVYSTMNSDGSRQEYKLTNYRNILRNSTIIKHPDNEMLIQELIDAQAGKAMGHLEYRANYFGGGYRWYRVYMRGIADETGKIVQVVGRADDVNEEKLEAEKLLRSAERDSLTGLYNRAATERLVDRGLKSMSSKTLAMLLILDLDNFKRINDKYGHMEGDVLLQHAAAMLQQQSRQGDVVGRVGGDELVYFAAGFKTADAIVQKTRRILDLFPDVRCGLSCSVGVAVADSNSDTYKSLLPRADLALYESKRLGKGTYTMYEENEAAKWKKLMAQSTVETRRTAFDRSGEKLPVTLADLSAAVIEMLMQRGAPSLILRSVLAELGQRFDVTRVCAFLRDPRTSHGWALIEQWNAPGMLPILGYGDFLDARMKASGPKFDSEGIFFLRDMRELPEREQEIVAPLGPQSLLVSAVKGSDGEWGASVAFDECRRDRPWTLLQRSVMVQCSRLVAAYLLKHINPTVADGDM